MARKICEAAKVSPRASTVKIGRHEADAIFQAIQQTKISPPATDCISPIGEELLLKGLHHVVPGEFYVAATRPPSVYRGNPFVIEAALAYGGTPTAQRVPLDTLTELLSQSDARTLRQFLTNTFAGLGAAGADRNSRRSEVGPAAIARPAEKARDRRAACRVAQRESRRRPDDERAAVCQPRAAAIPACRLRDHANDHREQLAGLRPEPIARQLAVGPVTVMVHMASVWVPFTSESKEAIASYPEIQKELRLALQAVGRKLGMYLRRRLRVKQEGERRNIFLRYLGEVATAVSGINQSDREACTTNCCWWRKRKPPRPTWNSTKTASRSRTKKLDLGQRMC